MANLWPADEDESTPGVVVVSYERSCTDGRRIDNSCQLSDFVLATLFALDVSSTYNCYKLHHCRRSSASNQSGGTQRQWRIEHCLFCVFRMTSFVRWPDFRNIYTATIHAEDIWIRMSCLLARRTCKSTDSRIPIRLFISPHGKSSTHSFAVPIRSSIFLFLNAFMDLSSIFNYTPNILESALLYWFHPISLENRSTTAHYVRHFLPVPPLFIRKGFSLRISRCFRSFLSQHTPFFAYLCPSFIQFNHSSTKKMMKSSC